MFKILRLQNVVLNAIALTSQVSHAKYVKSVCDGVNDGDGCDDGYWIRSARRLLLNKRSFLSPENFCPHNVCDDG